MKPFRIKGQYIAIGAQLALMAIISYALVTNNSQPDASTAPDLSAEVANVLPAPIVAPVVMRPLVPVPEPIVKAGKLDLAMKALSPKDASLYRSLFKSHNEGEWERAEIFLRQIEDRRLMGIVLADRFKKLGATIEEKKVWLKKFADLPDAKRIHAAAKKMGGKDLPAPQKLKKWSSGYVIDSATSFNAEQDLRKAADSSKNRRLARDIKRRISKGRPTSAIKLLRSAKKRRKLPDQFIAEAEALISASYFRSGSLEEATRISGEAARKGQPLGIWIRGLIAWQKENYGSARILFARLSSQNGLNDSNESAAHFWAYRSAKKSGHNEESKKHLQQAASHPKTLYGLLANQLLNKNPFKASQTASQKWNSKHRATLAKSNTGWRALALVQIGQTDRAEDELRHLNPQGNLRTRNAMLALTTVAPMPALTLKLASLKKKKDNYHNASYPILPWKPNGGFEIDRALLYALARQESRFDPMAVSYRGARGLMQIMPATAKYVAKTHNLKSRYYNTDALFDPALNMTLGQKYVRQLSKMSHIGNNLLLILAAYNAGPGNAMNWVKRIETKDPLLFLESIPTRETRQYVARVLPHFWAYRTRFNKPLDTLHQLANGQWPTASLNDDPSVRVAAVSGS